MLQKYFSSLLINNYLRFFLAQQFQYISMVSVGWYFQNINYDICHKSSLISIIILSRLSIQSVI